MIDPARNLSYNITIQCALDGFCFVIHDQGLKKIVDLELYQTSDTGSGNTITEVLEKALFKKGLYQTPLQSARYIVDNRLCTLVPQELFDAQRQESYFQFSHELRPGYALRHEILPALQAVNVFAVPARQEASLNRLWNNLQTTHRSSVFLNAIMGEASTNSPVNAYVNVNNRSFDLAVISEGRLAFFNNFRFNTKDDFAYFLLFALEQQPYGTNLPVHFSGLISPHSEIIQLCERYLKQIRFARPDGRIEVDMDLNDTPFHYYYIPYKSLSCAL